MATGNKTLLCIDRDLSVLRDREGFLRKNGYRVVTARNGYDGLRVFTRVVVDAIVLGYYLGLMEGPFVTAAMKQVRPEVPIVALSEGLELPEAAFQTVDAIVTKSDDPRLLLSTLQSVLASVPVPHVTNRSKVPPNEGPGDDRARVLDDLKSLIDSFAPQVKKHVIVEIHSVLAELAG